MRQESTRTDLTGGEVDQSERGEHHDEGGERGREVHGRRALHLHLRRPGGADAHRNLGETDQTARLRGRVDPASFRWGVLTIDAR